MSMSMLLACHGVVALSALKPRDGHIHAVAAGVSPEESTPFWQIWPTQSMRATELVNFGEALGRERPLRPACQRRHSAAPRPRASGCQQLGRVLEDGGALPPFGGIRPSSE